MARPAESIKVTIRLKISGQGEYGQTQLTLGVPGGSLTAATVVSSLTNTDLAAVNTAFASRLGAISGLNRAVWAEYNMVKVAPLQTNGKYSGEPKVLNTSGAFGTDTAGIPQSTVAVTLLTASPHRWGKKGRMYLPFVRADMSGTTPFIGGTTAQAIADGMRLFVNDINALAAAWQTGLCAIVPHEHPGTNFYAVNSVYVGTVVDTQKRRRAQLAETYYHHDL